MPTKAQGKKTKKREVQSTLELLKHVVALIALVIKD